MVSFVPWRLSGVYSPWGKKLTTPVKFYGKWDYNDGSESATENKESESNGEKNHSKDDDGG